MDEPRARFADRSGEGGASPRLWPPVVIPREEIEAEVERLARLPRPENGRRQSWIAHPDATEPGLGLAPGIRVVLEVLLPGEATAPVRHNSTQVNFCIRGSGRSLVEGRTIRFGRYDVWNFPSWSAYRHENDGDDVQVRLTYSNAPLLEKLNVHLVEENPVREPADREDAGTEVDPRRTSPYGTVRLADGEAWLMPYERLIDPPAIESKALHWPWAEVKSHLDRLAALGKEYVGRRLYLLYNPRTERTNGTTPNFFATMTIRPPNIVDRPHRHVSAAINYYFGGSGYSKVEGRRYEWKAGDLMLSAPGWGIHHHASYDEPVYELTIQDQPLHIGMESLLWQEDLKKPMAVLGAEAGFGTNRASATG